MSVGLLALLDDIAAIAKVAAASLDDVAGQAMRAGTKAAGVVIDDAAVTPRYVVGFAAERELPIVWKIAKGSLRNKLLILLPAALLLNYFFPNAVTPLLMIGGAYLCYEGSEKVYEAVFPHQAHAHEAKLGSVALNPQSSEDAQVAGAIKTDFILSAEIMTIALAAIPSGSVISQAIILGFVGIAITVGVYGTVALIVKADDMGVALATSTGKSATGVVARTLGRGLVVGMPYLLRALSILGTAAMIWVGGGIIIHGLDLYGFHALPHAIHHLAEAVERAVPTGKAATLWLTSATGYGLTGLIVGAALIPFGSLIAAPVWAKLKATIIR